MKNESKCLNPCPVVVTNPTPYKGGLNIAACDIKVKK